MELLVWIKSMQGYDPTQQASCCTSDCVAFVMIPALTFSTAPPSFTATPPQYVEAKEGGSTQLSCSAQGNPKPIISWLREGEELATDAKYSVRMRIIGHYYSYTYRSRVCSHMVSVAESICAGSMLWTMSHPLISTCSVSCAAKKIPLLCNNISTNASGSEISDASALV